MTNKKVFNESCHYEPHYAALSTAYAFIIFVGCKENVQ